MDANEEAIFFSLKPPQTYDNNYATEPFRWGRVTKKNGFLEVIFFEQKKSSDYITFTDVFVNRRHAAKQRDHQPLRPRRFGGRRCPMW